MHIFQNHSHISNTPLLPSRKMKSGDLLELLKTSSDESDIYERYLSYLQPFVSTSNKQLSTDDYLLLYNSNISILHDSLTLIPSRISESLVYPDFLFKTYNLLLDCLYIVITVVDPVYLVFSHEMGLMCSYVLWHKHDYCLELGLKVLRSIDEHILAEGRIKEMQSAIPLLILDIIMIFADCLRLSKSKVIDSYCNLIQLVDIFSQWIRFIDDGEKKRLHKQFVQCLTGCCANFIGENLQETNEELAIKSCAATLLENGKLFARGVEDSESNNEICMLLRSKTTFSFLSKLLDHLVHHIKAEPNEVEDDAVLDKISTLRISLEQEQPKEVEDTAVVDEISTLGISLERLRTLNKLKYLSPTIYQAIEEHVSKMHLEKIFDKQDTNFKNSRDHVEKGRKAREVGLSGLPICIDHLDAAIANMGDLSTKNTKECGPAYHVLAQAYCLRAFCILEKEPKSEVFQKDIANAIKLWLMEDHKQFAQHNPLVSEFTFKLLHRVCAVLLNKDCMEDHESDLYELMIECILWRGYSSVEGMIMLWQSKSLSHAFCTSPINFVFLEAFVKHYPLYNSMESWRSHFAKLEPAYLGFQNNMLIFSTSSDDEAIKAARLYVDQMQHVEEKLRLQTADISKSLAYLVANISYDLAERMVPKGFLTEAVQYAHMAESLRKYLWGICFGCEESNQNSIILMTFSVATNAWSYDHEDFILNPYVISRCRLESLFQEANIMEILGYTDSSMDYFMLGKKLSSQLGLSKFEARFSSAIAMVYRKKELWQEAGLELENLKNISKQMKCGKCKSSFEAVLDREAFDLIRQKMNETNDMCFKEAANYASAGDELWKSCAHKEKVDCAAQCGCKVRSGCDDLCWHCKPVIVIEPKLLTDIIEKKSEWTQRHYRLKVLIGIGKCLMKNGDPEKLCELFLECICLVKSMGIRLRSISFLSLFEYIDKNALQDVGRTNFLEDVIRIEVVSLAYAISWFLLKSYTGIRFESHAIPMTMLVSVLKYSFVVSREVPELFQKISRLLAIIYTLPDMSLTPTSSDAPSQSEWASFFHQASLGTNLNHIYQFHMAKMKMVPNESSASSSSLLRVAPESAMDLESFLRDFYERIGPTPISGISLLGKGYCGLLTSLLPDVPPSTLAWLFISRFSSACKPAVLLKPVCSVAGPSVDTSLCPPCEWGNSIVDKVAKVIRWIASPPTDLTCDEVINLREGYIVGLLKDMEHQWLGEWKFLLLGQLTGVSGCFLGWKDPIPLHTTTFADTSFYVRLTKEKKRPPLILVPDMDVQMLPWERMEMLKNEDIYRMPSVSGILYSYAKCSMLPIVDPFDVFYRIGPPENVHSDNLEKRLQSYSLKGKKSKDPDDIDELFKVLSSRDLFIYIGHRDGSNCIFGNQLRYLPKCSAAILVSCSSWVAAMNYLLSGSPFVIATLWDVYAEQACNYTRYLFDLLVGSQKCRYCRSTRGCEHTANIASFIGEARERCNLKYSMGAATICYGVPTKISKKNQ